MKQPSIYFQSRSSRLLIIIILTILIHLLLVLLLILPHTSLFINTELEHKLEQLHQKIQQHDPQDPWVTVNPQQSRGGAPVILVDDDDQAPTGGHRTKTDPAHHDPPKEADETEKALETDVEVPEKTPLENQELDSPIPLQTAKRHARPYDPQYVPASLFKNEGAPKPNQSQPSSAKKQKATKKQPLSITQLVRDFDTHLQQEEHKTPISSLSLSMIGQEANNAKMTERQLKEGRYMEKLAGCIIAAWKAHAQECPFNAPETMALHLEFVIVTSGAITAITILKSSGLRTVDQFVTRIMENAGRSFPPLPSFLSTNAYHIRCYLDGINPRQGPYRLVASQR
jgi:outer membrane biosynthesis protein TonB